MVNIEIMVKVIEVDHDRVNLSRRESDPRPLQAATQEAGGNGCAAGPRSG